MAKALALLLLASLAVASVVRGQDVPPAGTNCHRSCYTLDLAKALPLKLSYFKACKADKLVKVQKTARGDPKKKDRSVANAWGCGSMVQYKFSNWNDYKTYQACEHGLATYISQLRPYKISLPPSILRSFKC